MSSIVFISSCRLFSKFERKCALDFTYLNSCHQILKNPCYIKWSLHNLRRYISTDASSGLSRDAEDTLISSNDDVIVTYRRGFPVITVPLPSRKEKCRFTLRPISQTVGDFLDQLRIEDRGVERAVVLAAGTRDQRIRIASSDTIESLLEDDFKLIINDNEYYVKSPPQERLSANETETLSDVRNLVNQLYAALNVREHQVRHERELRVQIEKLADELRPLDELRAEIEKDTARKTSWLTWAGLGLMGVQFGVLARLTWWEYSWDIMEPVTYFVTYGTAMACYAYFVLTKQDYVLPDVKDRQYLILLHKKARKIGLDLNKYNHIRDEMSKLEKELMKMQEPTVSELVAAVTKAERKPLSAFETIRQALEGTTKKIKFPNN